MRAIDIDDLESQFDAYIDSVKESYPTYAAILEGIKAKLKTISDALPTVGMWIDVKSSQAKTLDMVIAYFPEHRMIAPSFRMPDGSLSLESTYGKASFVFEFPSLPQGDK